MSFENKFPSGEMPGLPKWPQMLTLGERVTPDQASEIIRRTDSFFVKGYGGNDKAYDERVRAMFDMGPEWCPEGMDPNEFWDKREQWRERWGCISTNYVHNTWISSSFVGGPYGWCHPDGRIFYTDNVGKWPSVEEVAQDWVKIAHAFPFLDLVTVLMNMELCEDETEDRKREPVAVISVNEGSVTVSPPEDNPFERYGMTIAGINAITPDPLAHFAKTLMMSPQMREHGIPEHMLRQWKQRVS